MYGIIMFVLFLLMIRYHDRIDDFCDWWIK